MSITVVATRHPRKLLTFLKSRYAVQNVQPGIYYVEGDTSPTQILVSEELPEDENVWLTSLRKDLTDEQIDRVLAAADGRDGVDAYLYAIVEANAETMGEQFMKRKKEGVIFSEKLDGFFRERYAPLIAEGETKVGREIILESIRERFGKVPKSIERAVNQMNDPIALKSLAVRSASCKTLAEFEAEL
jgi:hypothetical protein